MFRKVSIIGNGGMGTACASILSQRQVEVSVWGYDTNEVRGIIDAQENIYYLPGHKLPADIQFTSEDNIAMDQADLIVNAVPCQFVRKTWQRLREYVPENIPIVSVTKGFENKTLQRPTEILNEVISDPRSYAVLSGPTIADELMCNLPATITCASGDHQLAEKIQQTFSTDWFRVYTNTDMVGVEFCGAVKNVIAIAAGIIDGIQAGCNAKAALVTRGLAEMRRLGIKMGADEFTFSGLSGLGDLITTCVSSHGRNRSFGEAIGKGKSAKEALGKTKSVVEGAASCESVMGLAEKYDVEMPITRAVYRLINDKVNVDQAIYDLMTRKLKEE